MDAVSARDGIVVAEQPRPLGMVKFARLCGIALHCANENVTCCLLPSTDFMQEIRKTNRQAKIHGVGGIFLERGT